MGVGGSGKQSLAKFAAFVADCDLRTVSMAAGYNLARFREEVKHVLKVGAAVVDCAFCLTSSCTCHHNPLFYKHCMWASSAFLIASVLMCSCMFALVLFTLRSAQHAEGAL